MSDDTGPDPVPTDAVGHRTIARSFELTARRIQAFAAAVGDANPVYLDDARPGGLVGHPGLAFSFQWNSRHTPDVPPNPRTAPYGVHAWTDLRLARAFREGDIITSQGETVGVEQVQPGVLTVGRYRMTDAHGETVAELDYAGIVRGATTTGPDRPAPGIPPLPDPPASADPIWTQTLPVPAHAAHLYTEAADIYNPIHTERRVALAAGLPDIILHGSATQAMAISALVDRALGGDPTGVRRFYAQNRAMVRLGTTLTLRCLGDRATADGRALFFDVLTPEGAPALARGVLVAG